MCVYICANTLKTNKILTFHNIIYVFIVDFCSERSSQKFYKLTEGKRNETKSLLIIL